MHKLCLAVSFAALLLNACDEVISEHPASPISASAALPAAWEGTWRFVEFFGQTPLKPLTVTLAPSAAGGFTARFAEAGRAIEFVGSLLDLGPGHFVASLHNADGNGDQRGWLVFEFIESAPGKISAKALDQSAVRPHVQQGVIQGQVLELDAGHPFAFITAPTGQLAPYLRENLVRVFVAPLGALEKIEG